MEDDHLRSACFASLDVLCAQFGEDVPYKGGLDRGFPFAGRRVPFLSPQKGIFRAAVQRGPEALSINTSAKSPYLAVPETVAVTVYGHPSDPMQPNWNEDPTLGIREAKLPQSMLIPIRFGESNVPAPTVLDEWVQQSH